MSHSSEEEEEEEEEEDEDDETPLVTRKSSGFKMVTKVTPEASQDISGTMATSDGEYKKEVNEAIATRIESREVNVKREPPQQPEVKLDTDEIAKKEAEAHAQAEEQVRQAEARQAEIRAQQEEAMKKAQQEALLRAQQAQEQAIREAQERAQREAQMRAQQAQEKAIKEAQERAQREAQMRAEQAQAEAKAKQAEAEAHRRAQQEVQRQAEQAKVDAQKSAQQRAREAGSEAAAHARAMQPAAEPIGQSQPRPEPPKSAEDARVRREAQIKAERDRAEQLRAQQKAKMMAAEQARQAQIQAQKLQQNRKPEPQQRQQQQQQPVQQPQRPQVPTRQPQQAPQVPAKQPQRQQAQVPMKQLQQVPQQQQKGPVVPSKTQPAVPGKPQSTVPAKAGVVASGAMAAGRGAPERAGGGAQQVQNVQSSAISAAASAQQHKSAAPLIPYSEEEVRAMRGGDVQQAYLSKLNKPQALPEQQEVKPIHTQEDQSWVTQSRIPVEIQAPQPAKIIIPELHGAVDVKPTVIVPRPAQTTRVEWNEFPQDEVKEKRDVPRVKAGEWHPDNQGEIIGAQPIRSAYRPGRIGNVWPPPQSENVAPHREVTMTKTTEDTAWRRDERVEMETGTAWGKAGPHNLREQRIWPPPESEVRTGGFTGVRLPTVNWPPPEFEQQVQQDVEIIQTRLPVKPNQRQWPPPPPEYRPVANQNQIIAEQKTQQIPSPKKVQKATTVTKGMVRVGEGR